ncbi:MAG: MBL fold metallo-hydrolase [Myxococcota bacterium]
MNALHHHDVIVATLGSGSRGNSTYIGTEKSGVLVDCGLSTKQIFRRLGEIGLSDAQIVGVLVTHEHADHVGAARVLDRHLLKSTGKHVPFYMSRGTRNGLHANCIPTRVEQVRSGRTFQVGDFVVEPWTVPHDTIDPLAFAVGFGDVRAGVITDLGRPTRLVERQFGSLDIAVLEFNHDLQMLIEGDYPWRLKQRVRGAQGHLSNEQAGDVIRRGSAGRLKHLVLAHLSEDNNHPDVALRSAESALCDARAAGVTVHVASQQLPLGPLRVRMPHNLRPARVDPAGRASRARATASPEAPRDERQLSLFA